MNTSVGLARDTMEKIQGKLQKTLTVEKQDGEKKFSLLFF
jgi:hypothetical protein